VEPSKRYAELIIPEGGAYRMAVDAIIARVEHLMSAWDRAELRSELIYYSFKKPLDNQ